MLRSVRWFTTSAGGPYYLFTITTAHGKTGQSRENSKGCTEMFKSDSKTKTTVRTLFHSDLFAGAVLITALALLSWQGV